MLYRRDIRRDETDDCVLAEVEHVREHLAMCADYDDDPAAHRDQVEIRMVAHIDGDPDLISIVGELDAEPDAPYLRDDYDPIAEFDAPEFEFCRYSEEGQE